MDSSDSRHRLTHSETVSNLRLAFQERVAGREWTISEQEAEALLTSAALGTLLQSMTNLSKWLAEEKAERLMFYTENEIVNTLLPNAIAKEIKKHHNNRRKKKWEERKENYDTATCTTQQ